MKSLLLAAALVLPSLSHAIVPINGGMAPGTTIVVNNATGDQTDPHVSGPIAAYTDLSLSAGVVRYFNFATGVDQPIPGGSLTIDTLPSVSGNRISFSRFMPFDRAAIMVYDLSSGNVQEIAPQAGSQRFQSAISGNVVAFLEQAGPLVVTSSIKVADVAVPSAPAVTLSSAVNPFNGNPSVAPAGNAVVWESCNASFTSCAVTRSAFAGGVWGPPTTMSNGAESNPRTDGDVVVYQSERTPGDTHLYWQPLAGGAETKLEFAGVQSGPSISAGVIAFESRVTNIAPTDIFVYVIATNTVYQVTDSPIVSDVLVNVAVLPSGEVRVVWASNADADGSNSIYARTFRVPLGPAPYVQVSAGTWHTCALRGDGSVECWGSNAFAQAPASRFAAAPRSYTAVSAASAHTCALTDAGEAECWGNNTFRQAPARRTARTGSFVQLSSAGVHNCALRNDGVIECWGSNTLGQAPDVRRPKLGRFVQVAAGGAHTCALRDDSVVECWGSNANGQAPAFRSPISAGTYIGVTAGSAHTCATRRSAFVGDDAIECWGADGQGQAPVLRSGRYAQASAGGLHSCANLIAPPVFSFVPPPLLVCWGNNQAGQAPPSRTPVAGGGDRFVSLSAGWAHTCAINQASFIECWGDNSLGQAPAQRR